MMIRDGIFGWEMAILQASRDIPKIMNAAELARQQNTIVQAMVGLDTSDMAPFLRNITGKMMQATNQQNFGLRGWKN